MADIKYTPEQLLAQSAEMNSLRAEFEALFTQVTSALNGINGSWSENLARNFAGKIQAAQKTFSSVTSMLSNGASAAKLGATSHSPTSVDSALSALNGYVGDAGGYSGMAEGLQKALVGMSPEEKKKTLEDIDNFCAGVYDELPEKVKYLVERYAPPVVKDAVSTYRQILHADYDSETLGKVWSLTKKIPKVGESISTIGKIGEDFYKLSNEYENAGYYAESNELLDKGYDAFQDGKTWDGIVYYAEGAASRAKSSMFRMNEDLGLKESSDAIGDFISNALDWAGVSDEKVSAFGNWLGL